MKKIELYYKSIAVKMMKETPMTQFFNIEDNRFYHSPDGKKIIYTNNVNKKSTFFNASGMPRDGYIELGNIE